MALSCHLSMDPLRPRDEGCVKGGLGVAGFPSSSLCSECLEGGRRCSDAKVSSLMWSREMKEKERERRALLSCVGLTSFLRNVV